MIHPAREVAVVQAIFDRSTTLDADPAARSGTASDASPRNQRVPTVQAPGWLEAEPYITACTALADGVIESIDVLEGDFVQQGQVVARMVADDSALRLRRASADRLMAEASLAVAVADHTAAERTWAEPVELQRAIASGKAAVAEARAELEQLPALIASAEATFQRLNDEANRVRRSSEQGAANEFELFAAEQQSVAQQAQVDALRARAPILRARVERLQADLIAAERVLELRIEDRRQLDTAAAARSTAEARLLAAEAAHDEAALELERMTIRAPISGYVQRRLKIPGDKVFRMMDSAHSAHIIHIYDHSRLQVRVDVPLADASHVSVGQICEVVVEVLPDRVFRGEVLLITHEADLQKNTLQVKVKVIDPAPILRPEMLTRVKFLPTGQGDTNGDLAAHRDEDQRVLIPAQAVASVARGESETDLWLITNRRDGRGTLIQRRVRIVSATDGWLAVAGNVRPGDLIAVGVPDPTPGERVVIRIENAVAEAPSDSRSNTGGAS